VGRYTDPVSSLVKICTLWGRYTDPVSSLVKICTLWGRYTNPVSCFSKNMFSVILTVCETLLVEEVESGEYLPAQATDVIQLKPLPPPCTQQN
jgi:hypothetical protein